MTAQLLTDDDVLLAELTLPVRRPGLERSAGGISTTSAAQTPAAKLHLDAAPVGNIRWRRRAPIRPIRRMRCRGHVAIDYKQTPLRGLAYES